MMVGRLFGLLFAALGLWGLASGATAQPDTASRVDAFAHCVSDVQGIGCDGVLRIGVRESYPGFSVRASGRPEMFTGYEIDLANELAARLGVAAAFEVVVPVTRLSALADGSVDLVIATMGHSLQRDPAARFLEPHYYSSQTLLIGLKSDPVSSLDDLEGRTVCTTVGNYSNSLLAPKVARLLLFRTPQQLFDAGLNGVCTLIAQDDSLLFSWLQDPAYRASFSPKFGFAEVPWGAAMPRDVPRGLATAIETHLADMLRDGTLIRFAKAHGHPTTRLSEKSLLWQSEACTTDMENCRRGPLDMQLPRSAVAGLAERLQTNMQDWFGIELRLAVMESQAAWRLFLTGLVVALVSAVLAVTGTAVLSLVFAKGLSSRHLPVRFAFIPFVAALQNAPVILVLFFVGTASTWSFGFSMTSAVTAAALAIALINGAFAGQAISDAYRTIPPKPERMRLAVTKASVQVEAFMINAVRGISAASLIGVPDLLNALNDITSFTGEQSLNYWLLLTFYIVVVISISKMIRLTAQRWIPGWGT